VDYLDYPHPTEAVGGLVALASPSIIPHPAPAGRSAARYCAGYCAPVWDGFYVAQKKKAGSIRIRPSG